MGKRRKLHGIPLNEIEYKTWHEDGDDWERILFIVSKANGNRIAACNEFFGQSWCWKENDQWFVSVEAYKGNAWDWLHDDLLEVS